MCSCSGPGTRTAFFSFTFGIRAAMWPTFASAAGSCGSRCELLAVAVLAHGASGANRLVTLRALDKRARDFGAHRLHHPTGNHPAEQTHDEPSAARIRGLKKQNRHRGTHLTLVSGLWKPVHSGAKLCAKVTFSRAGRGVTSVSCFPRRSVLRCPQLGEVSVPSPESAQLPPGRLAV